MAWNEWMRRWNDKKKRMEKSGMLVGWNWQTEQLQNKHKNSRLVPSDCPSWGTRRSRTPDPSRDRREAFRNRSGLIMKLVERVFIFGKGYIILDMYAVNELTWNIVWALSLFIYPDMTLTSEPGTQSDACLFAQANCTFPRLISCYSCPRCPVQLSMPLPCLTAAPTRTESNNFNKV